MIERTAMMRELKRLKDENIIKKSKNKGMSLTLGDAKDVARFYEFIKDKTDKPLSYYRNFYNAFSKDNSIDLVFITIEAITIFYLMELMEILCILQFLKLIQQD